ncbi:hypothetical protein F2Q69_00013836 [Brassica cretica]|uniref:Uncharacterized protein n=1 Tax=Brassica cretica TaxID=69181 RepID=A0A8S9R6Y0_BRACR|nr:hypothetical protein F2Q69_00013836 [Brassica cretica]
MSLVVLGFRSELHLRRPAARPRACRHRRVSPLSLNSLFSFASSSCSLPSPSCPFLCSWSLVGVVFASEKLRRRCSTAGWWSYDTGLVSLRPVESDLRVLQGSALEVPFNSKSRLASTPACVGVVVFVAGSIVVVQWRRCRLWPVRRVARMLLSISLPLLGYLFILGQLKFTCLRFSEMGDCQGVRMLLVVSEHFSGSAGCYCSVPDSFFVRGIKVSIDFESPSCLGVLKIVQMVHERFSPRYSGGVTGVPGIRANEVNLTVPWSTLMVEKNFRFLRILKST